MIDDTDLADEVGMEASRQVIGAIQDLRRDPDSFMRWPWGALDNMTSGMAKGDVWFVAAFSGIGKTTFVTSAINRWLEDEKRIFALPLEAQPKRFRTYLACQRLGIKPGDAFTGELRRRNGSEVKALEAELISQGSKIAHKLRVESTREITLDRFRDACEKAAEWKADVLIVDHIDHIEAGDGTNQYAESLKVTRTALKMAQDLGLLLILTSQMNTDAVKGGDHLTKFAAPREQHIKYGGHKREVATGMIGLYRPLRTPHHDETPEDYKNALRQARSGDAEPHTALMSNTMGVVYMKDRNYGTDGRKCLLSVINGRVADRDDRRDDVRYGV